MTTYCCFVFGEDFPGELAGKTEPVAFFARVFVDAKDQRDAESLARQALDVHPPLTLADGAELPSEATITFKVVHRLEHVVDPTITEFEFFVMDDE